MDNVSVIHCPILNCFMGEFLILGNKMPWRKRVLFSLEDGYAWFARLTVLI
jgi:hypothetical protein